MIEDDYHRHYLDERARIERDLRENKFAKPSEPFWTTAKCVGSSTSNITVTMTGGGGAGSQAQNTSLKLALAKFSKPKRQQKLLLCEVRNAVRA